MTDPRPDVEVVAFTLGDPENNEGFTEGAISMVVTGLWQRDTPDLTSIDVLALEWRGSSELGRVTARGVLPTFTLDALEAAAHEMAEGRLPPHTSIADGGGGRREWESDDRDSRLVLTFTADGGALRCASARMTGIHGWPAFLIPMHRPVAEVGQQMLDGVGRIRHAYPRRTRETDTGAWELLR